MNKRLVPGILNIPAILARMRPWEINAVVFVLVFLWYKRISTDNTAATTGVAHIAATTQSAATVAPGGLLRRQAMPETAFPPAVRGPVQASTLPI